MGAPQVDCRLKFSTFVSSSRPIEKFPFLLLARDTIILQHLIIHFSLHFLPSGRLRKREVKNKGKFQTFSSKSFRGRLRAVVAYKRFQI